MKRNNQKILMIGSLPPPFIGPNVATNILISSEYMNNKFEIIFLDISDKREPKNIGNFDFKNIYLALLHAVKFNYLLIKKQPDLVYFCISQGIWGYLRDLCFYIPSVLLSKKIVVHLRGSEFEGFYESMSFILRVITKKLLDNTSNVIVLSESIKPIFRNIVDNGKIVVISNGIKYMNYGSIKKVNNSDFFNILYLSSLKERKGIFVLLDAVNIVKDKLPNVMFNIAGNWQSDLEKRKALSIINNKSLDKYIKFLGEISGDEKIELYKRNDIFVFTPILPEGMPWVLLEAMSAHLPIITTRQGAIPDMVLDGENGFLIDPDPIKLAEKIIYLCGDSNLRNKMGRCGRKMVENKFTEEIFINNIAKLFDDVLENKS